MVPATDPTNELVGIGLFTIKPLCCGGVIPLADILS
eukprot:SAG31_NODE_36465_length_313_cov_0.710280_1_plen_35_part_01